MSEVISLLQMIVFFSFKPILFQSYTLFEIVIQMTASFP